MGRLLAVYSVTKSRGPEKVRVFACRPAPLSHACSAGDGASSEPGLVIWLQGTREWRAKECLMEPRLRPSTWHSNGGLQLGRCGARRAVCVGTSCFLGSALAGAATRCAGELGCAAFVRASSRHGSAAGLAACATVRRLHAVCGWNFTVPCSSRAGCCLKISCVPIKGACESCTALDLRPCRDFCE